MPAYISEFDYFGQDPDEFVEVALPVGSNPADYSILVYDSGGNLVYTFGLGTVQSTTNGFDVYVINDSNPAFNSSGDPTGIFYPDDAIALVGPGSTVEQFISYEGNTVTAATGPAAGLTSTNVGSLSGNGSLQSDDGGSTYYAQSSPNEGTIPACFAAGTLISCVSGERPVETLRPGDAVQTLHHGLQPLRWVWSGAQIFQIEDGSPAPVLLRAGAFGQGLPHSDLVLSAQHRVLVGMGGQLEEVSEPGLCKALHLAGHRRVRLMRGKRQITWYHLLFDRHELLWSNGLVTESLYPGPMVLRNLSRTAHDEMRRALGNGPRAQQLELPAPALPFVGRSRMEAALSAL